MDSIGRFKVSRKLGEGAFGVVYEVNDEREMVFALKLAVPEILDTPAMRRFRNDAAALALLDHPNIVRVVETGRLGQVDYLLLEYCDGGNLDEWRRGRPGPIDPRQAASIVVEAARALEHAHARKILHRDIKPSNVLLRRRPATSAAVEVATERDDGPIPGFEVKLADFGLAKFLRKSDRDRTRTEPMTPVGTMPYAAPEQLKGVPEIDERVDVYGLGALLHELLTGRPPFEASDNLALLIKILQADPPRARALREDVPRDLESVVVKCMRKEPGYRYASAHEVRADLERFLAGRRTRADRLRPFDQVRKQPAAFIGAVLLILLAVLGLWLPGRIEAFAALRQSEIEASRSQSARLEATVRAERRLKVATTIRQAEELLRGNCAVEARTRVETADTEMREDLEQNFVWRCVRRHSARWWLWSSTGHAGPVYKVAFAPRGRLIASAGSDRTVRLWNAADGAPVRVLRGHNDEVDCVEFAPDGETLVSCGNDGRILLWRPDLDAPIAEIGRRDCEVVAVLFTRDGKRVIAGDHAGVVSVWDVAARRKLAEFAGGRGRIESLAITPDGRMLGVSSNPEPFRCFDLETYSLIRVFGSDSDSTRQNMSIAFSSDGRYCARSNDKGEVLVWNTESGDYVRSFFCSGARCDSVIFGPGNAYVAYAARDSTVRVRSFATPHLNAILRGHEGVVWNVAISPDGETLVSCGQDGTVRAWRPLANREEVHEGLDSAAEVDAAFNDDASRLVFAGEDGVVSVTDAETGELLSKRVLASSAPIHSACVSDDARFVATADKNGAVVVWDAHDGRRLTTLPANKLAAGKLKMSFSPGHVRLAVEATAAGVTSVWNWRTGAREFERRSIAPAANLKPQFSDDGKLVYTEDDVLKLWDFEEGRGERLLPIPAREVEIIAFNADDHSAAVGGVGGGLTIWDRATGLQRGDAFMRKAGWSVLAFSHRGGSLAATAYAHPVRLIDTHTQVELGQFNTNEEPNTLRKFVFAPDDSKFALVTITSEGQVRYGIHTGRAAPTIANKLAAGAP